MKSERAAPPPPASRFETGNWSKVGSGCEPVANLLPTERCVDVGLAAKMLVASCMNFTTAWPLAQVVRAWMAAALTAGRLAHRCGGSFILYSGFAEAKERERETERGWVAEHWRPVSRSVAAAEQPARAVPKSLQI